MRTSSSDGADAPSRLPGLVVSDLDGTLLRSDERVSGRTLRALELVRRHGVPVLFATGRPPRWLPEQLLPSASLGSEPSGTAGESVPGSTVSFRERQRAGAVDGVAICSNGALVHDLGTGRALVERPLDPTLGRRLIADIAASVPSASFAVERGDELFFDSGYHHRGGVGAHRRVPREQLFDGGVYKLLVQERTYSSDMLLQKAVHAITSGPDRETDALPDITHSGGNGLLEIAAPGVSKASTLAQFCAERGIDAADVCAFGDMPNDLEMLAWAGISYAMANAHPDVLQVADRRCGHHDDDGVATVLEQLFGAE